jgi:beta-1,4-mannosyl-glycoprotein beta-1,4-N-acetylglucosaminyltransferase
MAYSNSTFSGRNHRPVTYAPYETEVSAFSWQLVPLKLSLEHVGHHSWDRESALRSYLIVGVNQQKPQPSDLVMLSDVDEIPMPSSVRYLIKHPPKTFVILRAHYFYYSLRYQPSNTWARSSVILYGAINHHLDWYRYAKATVLPGFNAVHCSYCSGSLREIIRKLKTFSHTEYSSGKWVDPNFIIARVLCRMALSDRSDRFNLMEMNRHELDLPPQAEFMGWRLPFADLNEIDLNISEIRRMAPCNPLLKIVDGKLIGYE